MRILKRQQGQRASYRRYASWTVATTPTASGSFDSGYDRDQVSETGPPPQALADAGASPPRWIEAALGAPCPFVEGKTVAQTHTLFFGTYALGGRALGRERADIKTLERLHPDLFSQEYSLHLRSLRFTRAKADLARWYLMYLGELREEEATSFDDQVALLPSGYDVAGATETVLALLASRNLYGQFPTGKFMWGWCKESLSSEKQTHLAVSISGFRAIKFDEFPNQRLRANRYVVASRMEI